MDNQTEPMGWVAAKIASAWAAVGIANWNDAAGFLAFMYTAWLIAQKGWREHGRPYCEKRGWIQAAGNE